MAKRYFLFLISSFLFVPIFCSPKFSKEELKQLENEIQEVLAEKSKYIQLKEDKLFSLKEKLNANTLSAEEQYKINKTIIEEYRKYQSDSASLYISKNYELAKKTNNEIWLQESEIYRTWSYGIKGDVVYAKKRLEEMDPDTLMVEQKQLYYEIGKNLYSQYAQSTKEAKYFKHSNRCRTLILETHEEGTLGYKVAYASKEFYLGDKNKVVDIILEVIDEVEKDGEYYALLNHYLGRYYQSLGNDDLALIFYLKSGIGDLKSAIQEHASFPSLAALYYKRGNIDLAYRYVLTAIAGASFFDGYFRTTQSMTLLTIINDTYVIKEQQEKDRLLLFLVTISLLSLILVCVTIYTIRQVQKLSLTKKQLYDTNGELNKLNKQLTSLNNDLSETNISLLESNYIKEEYIAHFFDACSNYIEKIESYRKSLNKKALQKDIKSLYEDLKSNAMIDEELEELYKNFDEIFLNIYPDFVEDFNLLLNEEDRIYPKEKELLNTELRIYALIRLGIIDNVKIASFLRCSLRTVYNYRSKNRMKSIASRDIFEEQVKKIGLLSPKKRLNI